MIGSGIFLLKKKLAVIPPRFTGYEPYDAYNFLPNFKKYIYFVRQKLR